MNARVEKHYIRLDPPTLEDPLADMDRLLRELARDVPGDITVPLSVARALPGVLRDSGFSVTASIAHSVDTPTLISVEPGDTKTRCFGLAVDLGTTNVVCALVDLNTGAVLGEASGVNPQTAHGDDILTRIHYCMGDGRLDELQGEVVGCINGLLNRLAGDAGIRPGEVSCMSVSGNTTMAHFLLGLDPYHICRAPYTPAANSFGVIRAAELGLGINPEGPVYVLPNVGSYVGGDVLAGVLVSGMHNRKPVSILVDVGTNAEIVIGNSDWLLVCAGAAGPALEGGVARHGIRAMPGAIERVSIDRKTLVPSYQVIGGVRPKGICGSALIDLMAELFESGVVDGRGKFTDSRPAYVVVPADDSATGEDIVFTETDMDNLLRTKAAMYTVLSVVTRELGVSFREIEDFFVAGTFGAYIDPVKAVAIGMLPDIEKSRYKPLGNSSLKGAIETLIDRDAMLQIDRIAQAITYKEMNVSTDFMSEFRAAMFIPHTDSSLFPSLAQIID